MYDYSPPPELSPEPCDHLAFTIDSFYDAARGRYLFTHICDSCSMVIDRYFLTGEPPSSGS